MRIFSVLPLIGLALLQGCICLADPPSLLSVSTRIIATDDWLALAFRLNFTPCYCWRSSETLFAVRADQSNGCLMEINAKSGQERSLLANVPIGAIGVQVSPDGQWALLKKQDYVGERGWGVVHLPTARILRQGQNAYVAPDFGHVGQAIGLWQQDSRQWMEMMGSCREPIVELYTVDSPDKANWVYLQEMGGPWAGYKPSLVGITRDGRVIATSSMPGTEDILLYIFKVDQDYAAPKLSIRRMEPSTVGDEVRRQRIHQYRVRLPKGAATEEWSVSHQGDRMALVLYFEPSDFNITTVTGRAELWVCRLDGRHMRRLGSVAYTRQRSDHAPTSFPMQVSWLPDDRHLSFIYQKALWTMPVD
jgi:hypothetical protein